MLTTYDNPFNPFTQFDAWFKEDLRLGHDTCGYLARMSAASQMLSDDMNEEYIDSAMDEIVSLQPMIYKKVLANDYLSENKEKPETT